MRRRPGITTAVVALVLAALVLTGCSSGAAPKRAADGERSSPDRSPSDPPSEPSEPAEPLEPSEPSEPSARSARSEKPSRSEESASKGGGALTLAFAGDVHFEAGLAGLPNQPGSTLGPMSRHLRSADLAMVNLESALVREGDRTAKEREDPGNRYWFSSPPAALGVFARSGVDVVSLANNHGADFGAAGLRQTLRAAKNSKVAVVGVGRNAKQAFTPHRVTVKGTDVSVLAADTVFRESDNSVWAAGEGGPGIASARGKQPRRLLSAVRKAEARGDLVVVYLHWGSSLVECPTDRQRRLARQLARAGADVVVGAHAHVLLGAGMLRGTYVSYGLGNFAWYHGARSRTGVLKLRVRDDRVVRDTFIPARIPADGGRPQPLAEARRSAERADWKRLRGCTGLGALR